jgi:hypothetical protein
VAKYARVAAPLYSDNVFLNVPFDTRYRALFRALVFAIHDCGFQSRCALETSDAGEVRVEKLYRIIEECRYGIHDISRTSLDTVNRLPRFNMPLELGVFLGARRYGTGASRQKSCLILDRDRYRYQKYCSDLAGQDIRAHGNRVTTAIGAVRDWLSAAGRRPGVMIPGGRHIAARYEEFCDYLPKSCRLNGLALGELTFLDFRTLLVGWLDVNPW